MSNDPRSPLQRGLPSIQKARAERERVPVRVGAIHGVVHLAKRRPPLRAVMWFASALLVAGVVYYFRISSSLEKDRQALMADQRAVEAEIGGRFYPLRDKIEGMTAELAKTAEPEVILTDELARFRFQETEGIYLRLRLDEAGSVETIRDAAKHSYKDAFTACLMKGKGQEAASGGACASSRDCKPGELCNELDQCAKPIQPFNLRLAYRSLQILTPEWVRDVQDASNDLRLRAMRGTFDDAVKVDLPIAIDIITKADFFLVVIDERPKGATPPPSEGSTGGGPSEDDVADASGNRYASRVGLYRLSDGKQLLRLRRDPEVELHGTAATDVAMEASRQRQARSCALALDVRSVIGDK